MVEKAFIYLTQWPANRIMIDQHSYASVTDGRKPNLCKTMLLDWP
jgi:hypothetical protein